MVVVAVLPACTVDGGDEIPDPLLASFVGTGESFGMLDFFSPPSSESEGITILSGECGRLLLGVMLILRRLEGELDSLSDDDCICFLV